MSQIIEHERTMAIDVGSHCGWAILSQFDEIIACGCIHLDKVKKRDGESVTEHDIRRALHLYLALSELRRVYGVRVVVGEVPSGGSQSSRAGACMAQNKITVALAMRHCECHWVAPQRTKEAAEAAVTVIWPQWIPPAKRGDAEHIFDALSAFLIWRNPSSFEKPKAPRKIKAKAVER